MGKRKQHYLLVDHTDGTRSYDPITDATEEGITVAVNSVPVIRSPNWLDEHRCYINDYRHRLPRPFHKHCKDLAKRLTPMRKARENCSSQRATG